MGGGGGGCLQIQIQIHFIGMTKKQFTNTINEYMTDNIWVIPDLMFQDLDK